MYQTGLNDEEKAAKEKAERKEEEKAREEKAAKAKAEEKEEEKARKEEERARRLEERNWKIEDDERKIAAKREEDDRKHKHETELRRINSNMAATERAGEHSTRFQLKFRDLREGEEILNYLTQFECIATTNNYSRSMWASTLLSRLTGECLNIIGTLADIQKMDYDHIKKKTTHLLWEVGGRILKSLCGDETGEPPGHNGHFI
ncbi:ensconsin-like [Physella acuta]|uniref:ensconsin-like n=1 Tax=Physella acuta TaxID=109671 RepID=UPI0027DC6251|nr:ensconsin-like [Physella acuta]